MKGLLVHGCYDILTLKNLLGLGVSEFAFDLRARSPNLIPFHHLQKILPDLKNSKVVLMFENDKDTTVLSFLNILEKTHTNFILEFRDFQIASYYEALRKPFYWTFNPLGDWRSILATTPIKGVILPLKFQTEYQHLPEMWKMIEDKNLEIYLHAESFDEANFFQNKKDIMLSLDLGLEIESGFRLVDQEKLRKQKFWGNLNENIAI